MMGKLLILTLSFLAEVSANEFCPKIDNNKSSNGFIVDCKIFLSLAVFLSIALIYSIFKMNISREARFLQGFPSFPKVPFVGSSYLLLGAPENLAAIMDYALVNYGSRFVFWLSHKPYLVCMDAYTVQKVLASPKCIDKSDDYKNLHWILGNGLISSNGPIWRSDRKLFNPSFNYQSYDGFLEIFNRHSRTLVEILNQEFHSSKLDLKPKNIHPIFSRATMDFIVESALGQKSNFQLSTESQLMDLVNETLHINRIKLVNPWLSFPVIRNISGIEKAGRSCRNKISVFIQNVICKRKVLLSNMAKNDNYVNSRGTKPFIDSLLGTEAKSNDDIFSHIMTIFGAGFETTASTMNFTLFLLALNPSCQKIVAEEIDSIFPPEMDDLTLTFEDLSKLKYLEMCIKESLRIFPPAPATMRKTHEDIELKKGQIIPKGITLLFPIYHIHRDPVNFPEPEEFRPERFLPEECASRHPYAYIPFSVGPRSCIGMKYAMIQMKTVLCHILRRFTVSTKKERGTSKMVYGLVLEPSPALELQLQCRVKN